MVIPPGIAALPRFGLIDVDRKTLERRVKASGGLYARIAQSNSVGPLP